MGDIYEQRNLDAQKQKLQQEHAAYMESHENIFEKEYLTGYGNSSYVKTTHLKRAGKRTGFFSKAYAAITKSAEQEDIEAVNTQRVKAHKGLHSAEDDGIFNNASDVEQIRFFRELKDLCASLCQLDYATGDFIEAINSVDDYITAENYDDQQKYLGKALEALDKYAQKAGSSDNDYEVVLASKAASIHRMISGKVEGTLEIPEEYREQASEVHENPKAGFAGTYSDVSKLKLFPHEPSPNDVKQRTTSDCYMMSALCSIAASQPDVIKKSMVDNGDTVTVRFFEPLQRGQTQAKPVYITVTKEIPTYLWVAQKNAVDSLWVQMIEKAFAVYYGNEHIRDVRQVAGEDDGTRSYEALDFQDSFAFLSRFLGPEYANQYLSTPPIIDTSKLMQESEMAEYELEDEYRAVQKIVNEPMSDIYSGYAARLHDQWKTRLDRKEIITVGANSDAVKSKGIRSHHAYSVLKVYDVKVGEKTRRYVRLRDPYGAFTADYSEKSKQSTSTGNSTLLYSTETMGTFDMEWNEFLGTFDSYCGCMESKCESCYSEAAQIEISERELAEEEAARQRAKQDNESNNFGFDILDEDEFK